MRRDDTDMPVYESDKKWLNKNGFELKDRYERDYLGTKPSAFIKTYESGLSIAVRYDRDEDLFYAEPCAPIDVVECLDVSYFQTCMISAQAAVEECIAHYKKTLEKLLKLVPEVESEDQ